MISLFKYFVRLATSKQSEIIINLNFLNYSATDTEAILEPVQHEDDEDTSAKCTVKTSPHIPCSITYKLTSHLPGYEDEQVTCKFGPNCIE